MQNDGSESLIKIFFNNKWTRIILIVDALIMVFLVIAAIWNATKTATIVFDVAPIDAKIMVGSDHYENGSFRIHPGTYDVTVSRDGLDTKTFTLELCSGDVVNLSVFLKSGEDNFDFYTFDDNYASFRKLAEIGSHGDNSTFDSDFSAESFISDYEKKYDLFISDVLPIDYSEYELAEHERYLIRDVTVRRGNDEMCEKTLCLEVLMALTKDEDLVKNLLIDNGLNPEDYEIHYEFY